jgi:hypothetical protein
MTDEPAADETPASDDGPVYNLGRAHSVGFNADDYADDEDEFDPARLGEAAQRILEINKTFTNPLKAIRIPDFLTAERAPLPNFAPLRNPQWEIRDEIREVAQLLADQQAEMEKRRAVMNQQRAEDERKEAERDAREERALKVAEDALAEARKARIITAWSVAIAVVALIVTVITIFVAG